MDRASRVLIGVTATLWTATLLFIAPSTAGAYQRILVGLASTSLGVTGISLLIERARQDIVTAVVARLGRKLDFQGEVRRFWISIGREEERAEHVAQPVLLSDYRKAEHCPADCQCRESVTATAAQPETPLVSMSRGLI